MTKLMSLMQGVEYDRFYEDTERHWKDRPTKDLEAGLRFNLLIKQQVGIRIQIIQEYLDERAGDKKSNQFAD